MARTINMDCSDCFDTLHDPGAFCEKHQEYTDPLIGGNMDGQVLASGTKKDEGKARWDLLPFEVIDAVARILTKGAQKYEARNWERGIAYGRVFAGVMRHLTEFWMCKVFGRDGINTADGVESHIDHAITGLMFISAYEKRGLSQFDDRPGVQAK